jgi:hypothetical protein
MLSEKALEAAWMAAKAHGQTIKPISVGMIMPDIEAAIEAYLSALKAEGLVIEQGWKPIETAPKWPVRFLAYFPEDEGDGAFVDVTADTPERGPMIGGVEPVLWRPLPEPPLSAHEDGK